ncbi:MAG: Arc family DNA-binding protein [Gammaproteobacteria bacterium]|nr:Arc family DNA-binding protein [Gammaproteobacteria bacterium]
MTVNLSIKNVPSELATKIKKKAAGNHRSLQGELLAILEASVKEQSMLTPKEVLAQIRSGGLSTPAESVKFVKEDRNARSRR